MGVSGLMKGGPGIKPRNRRQMGSPADDICTCYTCVIYLEIRYVPWGHVLVAVSFGASIRPGGLLSGSLLRLIYSSSTVLTF